MTPTVVAEERPERCERGHVGKMVFMAIVDRTREPWVLSWECRQCRAEERRKAASR